MFINHFHLFNNDDNHKKMKKKEKLNGTNEKFIYDLMIYMIVEMTETKDDINNDYDYYKWAILVSFDLLILFDMINSVLSIHPSIHQS